MINHYSYKHNLLAAAKEKLGKCSGLNGNRTQGICNTGAVLYQLSYQAN